MFLLTLENSEILSDYEQALRKAIKQAFPSAKLSNCFFHYIKNIRNKTRKLSISKKCNKKERSKLIFFFEIYPFIDIDKKVENI